MALSQGLLVGRRQGTILTAASPALSLTQRLWAAIQLRTSRLFCASWRCPRPEAEPFCRPRRVCRSNSRGTAWLWRSAASRPRTLSRSLRIRADTSRSKREPSAQGRPFSVSSRSGPSGGLPPPRSANSASQNGKTRSHPPSPKPTQDGSERAGSAGREPLFAGIFGIGTLHPALGSLPAHPQPIEGGPDGLACNPSLGYALLEADLRSVL
jgi:hypothetical protein